MAILFEWLAIFGFLDSEDDLLDSLPPTAVYNPRGAIGTILFKGSSLEASSLKVLTTALLSLESSFLVPDSLWVSLECNVDWVSFATLVTVITK